MNKGHIMVSQFLKNLESKLKNRKVIPKLLGPHHEKQWGMLQNMILKFLLIYLKSPYITIIKVLHDLIRIL